MSTAWYGGEWIVGDSLGLELEKEGMRLEKREEVAGFGMEITASRRAKLKNQLRAGEEKLLWTVGRDSAFLLGVVGAGILQAFKIEVAADVGNEIRVCFIEQVRGIPSGHQEKRCQRQNGRADMSMIHGAVVRPVLGIIDIHSLHAARFSNPFPLQIPNIFFPFFNERWFLNIQNSI